MTTTEEPLDLAAIQARAEAATAGPWRNYSDEPQYVLREDMPVIIARVPHDDLRLVRVSDAEFIAHAREDVPALVARVRALEAERDAAQAKIVQAPHAYSCDRSMKLDGADASRAWTCTCWKSAILAQQDEEPPAIVSQSKASRDAWEATDVLGRKVEARFSRFHGLMLAIEGHWAYVNENASALVSYISERDHPEHSAKEKM